MLRGQEQTRLWGCGIVTCTAEAPTGGCDIPIVSQSCCVVGGSVVDSSHSV